MPIVHFISIVLSILLLVHYKITDIFNYEGVAAVNIFLSVYIVVYGSYLFYKSIK